MVKRLLFLAFILILPPISPLWAERQLLDRIIAVVNEEAITQSELDFFLKPLYEQYKNQYGQTQLMEVLAEARQKLMSQLIEDRLVFQEAKEQKIAISEEEIEGEMSQFKKRFKTEQELEDGLRKDGLTLNDVRERLQRQAMVRRLQDMEIRSKIVVSPMEIQKYFEDHPAEFSNQESLKIRSITLKKSEEAREKGLTDERAKNKALELRHRILSGEDFGDLAKQYSEDTNAKSEGLSQWVEKGEMIPAIDEIIFNMKIGEISQMIETPMGYHLFRVEKKRAGQAKTLDAARDKIHAKLFQDKARKRFQEWMLELKRHAYISVR